MLRIINKKIKNVILYMTFLAGIVIFLIPLKADAANYERVKVRVGWFYSPQFQEGMSDEDTKSGYCYDYLHTVANYNGWEYEYVYGGWSDLLEMLKNGEIDVMGGVSPSEERMNYMLFPDYEMGTDKYSLYQHPEGSLDPSDKASFEGIKIGTVKDNHMTVYLQDWLEKKGLEPHLIYFNSIEEKDAAFTSGLIDAMVATDNNVVVGTPATLVAKIGEEPFYLAIAKNRADLIEDLSFALTMMDEIEPYLLQNLRYKNYGATVSNSTFTEGEIEWIESHDTIRVGYFDNYLPYSGTDSDGNATGLMTDVFSGIISLVGLKDKIGIEYTAYESYEDMLLALQEGTVDCVFPVSAGNAYLERMNMDASISVVEANMNLVYKGNLNDSIYEKIAISNSNGMAREYAERSNAFKNITYYDNTLDCLMQSMKGRRPVP